MVKLNKLLITKKHEQTIGMLGKIWGGRWAK